MVQIRTMWTENQQLNSDIRRSLYKEELVLQEIKMQVFVRCIHRRVFDMDVIIAAEYEVRMRCFRGENPATQRWFRQFIRNHLIPQGNGKFRTKVLGFWEMLERREKQVAEEQAIRARASLA